MSNELQETIEKIKQNLLAIKERLPEIDNTDQLRAINGGLSAAVRILELSEEKKAIESEDEEDEEKDDLRLGLETNAYTKLVRQVVYREKDGLMRSKTPERKVTDLYSEKQLARVRTVVETVLNERGLSYESLAQAINSAAGEHRCTKDSLNRLAHIGKNSERSPVTNQALIGFLDLAYVSHIYTEEDLRAIALGNPPVTERALSYHPEDRLLRPIEEKMSEIVGSVKAGKERIAAIEQEVEILVGELKKEFDRLELLKREMSEKK